MSTRHRPVASANTVLSVGTYLYVKLGATVIGAAMGGIAWLIH